MYSQNNEEEIIRNYFKDREQEYAPSVLDIGANDGATFSNSAACIDRGWYAVLVEPSDSAIQKLNKRYGKNSRVEILPIAISTKNGTAKFFDSGTLIGEGDSALVSTIVEEETNRWPGMQFNSGEVETMDYETAMQTCYGFAFDLISIDAEGMDYEILTQIDLRYTNMVIVEFNGKEEQKYIDYCAKFGLKEIARNGENLIFAR